MNHLGLPTKVYLAGRIEKNGWRHRVVEGLRNSLLSTHVERLDIYEKWKPWPILHKSILGYYDYVGPYFISDDHGCAHGCDTHGAAAIENGGCLDNLNKDMMKMWIYSRCLKAIDDCEMLVAWIDDKEAFGTIAEIGYAYAMKKDITILGSNYISDLWFTYQLANIPKLDCNPDPAKSVLDFLKLWVVEPEINYREYILSHEWKVKAKTAKKNAGYRCQLCNRHKDEVTLHAHHRTYDRLGDELPEDITVLCADCHAKFHNKVSYG